MPYVQAGGRIRVSAHLHATDASDDPAQQADVEGTADESFDLLDRLVAELVARMSESIEPFRRALELEPANPIAQVHVGRVYALEGSIQGLRESAGPLMQFAPESDRALEESALHEFPALSMAAAACRLYNSSTSRSTPLRSASGGALPKPSSSPGRTAPPR